MCPHDCLFAVQRIVSPSWRSRRARQRVMELCVYLSSNGRRRGWMSCREQERSCGAHTTPPTAPTLPAEGIVASPRAFAWWASAGLSSQSNPRCRCSTASVQHAPLHLLAASPGAHPPVDMAPGERHGQLASSPRAPPHPSTRTWSTVAWTSRVSVVVMVCRATRCALPTLTGPICAAHGKPGDRWQVSHGKPGHGSHKVRRFPRPLAWP